MRNLSAATNTESDTYRRLDTESSSSVPFCRNFCRTDGRSFSAASTCTSPEARDEDKSRVLNRGRLLTREAVCFLRSIVVVMVTRIRLVEL